VPGAAAAIETLENLIDLIRFDAAAAVLDADLDPIRLSFGENGHGSTPLVELDGVFQQVGECFHQSLRMAEDDQPGGDLLADFNPPLAGQRFYRHTGFSQAIVQSQQLKSGSADQVGFDLSHV
jgi:hypothetical protein